MPLFDAHNHLQASRILEALPDIMAGWERSGGKYLVCCGGDESDWEDVLSLSRAYGQVITSFGVHPWYVRTLSPGWENTLVRYLETIPSAVGEIGLDFAIPDPNRDLQEAVFTRQLQIAREMNLPVSIHVRKAWEAVVRILRQVGTLPARGLVHSYSGSADMVPVLEKFGLMISFSGSITYPGNKKGIKAIGHVSGNNLLIETDSPDIRPRVPETDGQVFNIPENLIHVARAAAEARGSALESLIDQTHANGTALFSSVLRIP
ncbi:MAG: TatD family hydrolase [Pseudomonadota bacterium]